MKKILVFSVCVAAMMFSACVSVIPVGGATGQVGSKVGKASATSILYFPAIGDAGITKAAKGAGITKVGTVDMERNWWVLGITYTTIVTGE